MQQQRMQMKNNAIGYGLANVKQAMLEAGIIVSPFITYPINNLQRVACYIMSKTAIVNPKLSVYNANRLQLYTLYPTDTPHLFAADIPHNQIKNNTITCYVEVKDSEFRKEDILFFYQDMILLYRFLSIKKHIHVASIRDSYQNIHIQCLLKNSNR